MSATRAKAGPRNRKLAAVICLLAIMVMGLAACRGFFGQAPIASLLPGDAGDQEVPITITFDISGSSDPDGTIITYDLDFGDGSTHATGTDVADVITYEYDVAGAYTVILTITDNDGRIDMVSYVQEVGSVMITFAASRVTQYDIFRMQGDGTNQGAVRNTAVDELFPDLVRGTRDKIAYAAEDAFSWNIHTMTVEGLSVNQLTTQTASNQIQPSWSSDGSSIAYASNATQTPSSTTWELFTMTAAGVTQTKLTAQAPSWAIAPAYSPVNDDILFVSNKTATGESSIWLWDDEEDEAAELYDGPGNDGDASPSLGVFSPPLLLPAEAGISKPAWSLDGTEIAFSTERTDGGIIDIYVIDVSGAVPGTPVSLETYVTTHASYTGSITAATITSGEDEFSPYWLEDGSGMVFVKEIAGAYHVYKVSFITGLVTKLTATGANISPASNR